MSALRTIEAMHRRVALTRALPLVERIRAYLMTAGGQQLVRLVAVGAVLFASKSFASTMPGDSQQRQHQHQQQISAVDIARALYARTKE